MNYRVKKNHKLYMIKGTSSTLLRVREAVQVERSTL